MDISVPNPEIIINIFRVMRKYTQSLRGLYLVSNLHGVRARIRVMAPSTVIQDLRLIETILGSFTSFIVSHMMPIFFYSLFDGWHIYGK